jgi:hypothetical protein
VDHLPPVALVVLTAVLVACGLPRAPNPNVQPTALLAQAGSLDDTASLSASTEAARALGAPRGRAPLLLSPFGKMPQPAPASYPQDPTVRTRVNLYATQAEAEALDSVHRGDVAWVEVGCCSLKEVDVALGVAAGQAAAKELAADAPVFVSGASLHLAALAVDRLNEQGHTRVFLVTR